MSDPTGAAGMTPDADRIGAQLAELVAIPSVTGDEFAIQDVVARMVAEAGMTVERLEVPIAEILDHPGYPGTEVDRTTLPIVAGRLTGSSPGPRLMLVGHVDVVPPGDPETWTTPAFEPAVRDGNLYGRGACDMKGGVVAALEACRLVADHDFAGEIVFVAVPSEEDGGTGALAAILRGYTGDACVITEPTNMDIVTAHGGAITFTLDIPGKAAHASMRREGASALDHLGYLVEALRNDEMVRNAAETHPLMQAIGLPYPTIIGQVEGGNWASTVMDRVVAHGRYGVKLGQNCDGAADDLRKAIDAAAAEHEFLATAPPGVTVWGGRFDSSSVPLDHPLPRAIQDASETSGHRRPELVGAPYGADMRLFINQGSTPTVMYGPGDVRVAHAADEHVPLGEVAECAEVLATWLHTSLS
jgi:acetylornithine deacetylase